MLNKSSDNNDIPQLFSKPVIQRAFWKQIQADVSKGVVNKMTELSIKQILDLIQEQKTVCSFCGNRIPFRMPLTTEELKNFIANIINPMAGYSCNDCYEKCKNQGRIIAEERSDDTFVQPQSGEKHEQ